MSTEPSKRSLNTMHEVLLDDGGLAPWTTALAADRLIAEAVQAERQRILDALAKEEWPDPETGHPALLSSVVRSIMEDTP